MSRSMPPTPQHNGMIVGGFYSEVALQKREAEGTVHMLEATGGDCRSEGRRRREI